MTPERIVELGKQAEVYGQTATRLGLERFAELVAKEVREEERERCAMICDMIADDYLHEEVDNHLAAMGASLCAKNIREEDCQTVDLFSCNYLLLPLAKEVRDACVAAFEKDIHDNDTPWPGNALQAIKHVPIHEIANNYAHLVFKRALQRKTAIRGETKC